LRLHGSSFLFFFLIVFILPLSACVENRVFVWIPGHFVRMNPFWRLIADCFATGPVGKLPGEPEQLRCDGY